MKRIFFLSIALIIFYSSYSQDTVTAVSPFGVDNVLIRSDGTGRGVQASGITIDDSENIFGVNNIEMGNSFQMQNTSGTHYYLGFSDVFNSGILHVKNGATDILNFSAALFDLRTNFSSVGYGVFNNYIQATTGKFTSLANGYVPYTNSSSYLDDSPLFTNGINSSIGTEVLGYLFRVEKTSALPTTSSLYEANLLVSGGQNYLGFGTSSSGNWIQSSQPSIAGPAYKLLLNPIGGNVGIGTNSPSSLLEIAKSDDNMLRLNRIGVREWRQGISANGYFQLTDITESVDRLTIDTSGKFGIGTTTPLGKLNINTSNGSINTLWGFTADPDTYNLYLKNVDEGGGLVRWDLIQTNNNVEYNALTFKSGNVGIGTTTPTSLLDVNGTVHVTGGSFPSTGAGIEMLYLGTDGIIQSYDRDNSLWRNLALNGASIQFMANGSNAIYVNMSANSGFGKTTGINNRIDVNGWVSSDNGYKISNTELKLNWLKSDSIGASGTIPISTGTGSTPVWGSINTVLGGDSLDLGYMPYFNGTDFTNSPFRTDGTDVSVGIAPNSDYRAYLYDDSSDSSAWALNVFQDGALGNGVRFDVEGDSASQTAFLVRSGSGENELLKVLANGNVGINDTLPVSALDVCGDINADSLYRLNGDSLRLDWLKSTELAGTNGYLSVSNGTNPVWTSIDSLGFVASSDPFGADNKLIKSDGTGNDVQASGITIDDSENIFGASEIKANAFTTEGGYFILENEGWLWFNNADNSNSIRLNNASSHLDIYNQTLGNYADIKTGSIISNSYLQATTGKFTNLSDGYIPYHVSVVSGLENSPIEISSGNVKVHATLFTNIIRDLDAGQLLLTRDNSTGIIRIGSGLASDYINIFKFRIKS